jgi:cell division protein FtsI (penicillin-binding protein 3)
LPDQLPDGAHRVISELTAAQMRKMMQDVVLMGTAHGAVHLNGYSAAGKTGTAQKIDPRTHTYSKTNFVASFVGFAPVNNPAITIAVVMDSPQHSMHFGAQASAPVFQDLAQQILEYLGVPHDEPMLSPGAKAQMPTVEEEPAEHVDDLDSLFAEVNNLPPDDPLRANPPAQTRLPESKDDHAPPPLDPKPAATLHPSPAVASSDLNPTSQPVSQPTPTLVAQATVPTSPTASASGTGSVVVASGDRVAVPSFVGEPVRKVIEQAGGVGLGVQVLGTGIARGQAPAAGTMVPAGTAVVVRFGR